jgi:hypothetical protein
MNKYKVIHRGKTYKVTAKDSTSAVLKVMRLKDDRLSPMTYSKLKELGYSSEDWKDLNQEQANEIVAKGKKTEQQSSQKKGEEKKESKSSSSQNKPSPTQSKQPIRQSTTPKISAKKVNNMMDIMAENDWMWNLAVSSDFEDVGENDIEEMKNTYFEETGKEISDDELKHAFKKMRKAYEEE